MHQGVPPPVPPPRPPPGIHQYQHAAPGAGDVVENKNVITWGSAESVDKFIKIEQIGEGTYGEVRIFSSQHALLLSLEVGSLTTDVPLTDRSMRRWKRPVSYN